MKFSVIIPVYNCASYLRECLDSVCAAAEKVKMEGVGVQRKDRPFVEVICVDDGSTDGSGEMLDEYAHRSTPTPSTYTFRVLHQQNRGEGGARNVGLDVATGDWIEFVDADDLLAPTAFADAMMLIGRHPDADLVALGKADFRNDKRPDSASEGGLEERVLERRDCLPRAVAMVGLFQMFIRRDICADLRFTGYCMGADRVYVHQVIRRVRKAVLSDKVGYFYRIHGASVSHSRMTFRKRWDNFRHAAHVLAILLVTPQAGWRIRLRYVRATGEKLLGVLGV